jgi:hypothetical protein
MRLEQVFFIIPGLPLMRQVPETISVGRSRTCTGGGIPGPAALEGSRGSQKPVTKRAVMTSLGGWHKHGARNIITNFTKRFARSSKLKCHLLILGANDRVRE